MLQEAPDLPCRSSFQDYRESETTRPLFLHGDTLHILRGLPDESIDCCMTSPPYWGHRQYASAGIGLEESYPDYIRHLCRVCDELKRVLKPTGSFWLNIGDTYQGKRLLGIPWRVALQLIDHQGWLLRNDVIWNKVKGAPDNAKDKLRNVHEHVFHFVKSKSYFYDVDAIRSAPRKSKPSSRSNGVLSRTPNVSRFARANRTSRSRHASSDSAKTPGMSSSVPTDCWSDGRSSLIASTC